MKTQENIDSVLQQVSDKLLLAQQEIDELTVQLALGKVEAKDKFEEIKHTFRMYVMELKNFLNASQKAITPEVKTKLEDLELQLVLGKADTKDLFEVQKKKIMQSISNLEEAIKKNWSNMQMPDFFGHEVEQFKLKMEILRLRFRVKGFNIRDGYRKKMQAVRREIKRLATHANDKVYTRPERYNDFRYEISLAYKHLKNAVESLT
jgi:phage host-nuclease inhibitor protein Gam